MHTQSKNPFEPAPAEQQPSAGDLLLARELVARAAANRAAVLPVVGLAAAADSVIAMAKSRSKPVRPEVAFVPVFGSCDAHGSYPRNVLDGQGVERWFAEVCPACTKQLNAAKLLAASNIPRRFATCDFGNYHAATEEQQLVLERCERYARDFAQMRDGGVCLMLCGKPGTGKNHLATAISRQLLDGGYTVLRVKAGQYLDAYWAKSFEERESWIRSMADVDLLMLDEVGRSSSTKAAQDAFFRLLDARYEAQLPTLLTTNLNKADLVLELGDAGYDRLTEGGGSRLTLGWESYRARASVGVA